MVFVHLRNATVKSAEALIVLLLAMKKCDLETVKFKSNDENSSEYGKAV